VILRPPRNWQSAGFANRRIAACWPILAFDFQSDADNDGSIGRKSLPRMSFTLLDDVRGQFIARCPRRLQLSARYAGNRSP
jgi:hypothetical protein